MSDDELKRRRKLFKEELDLVVERQPQSSFSAVPVIIALFVVYILFYLYVCRFKSGIRFLSDSVISEVEISEPENSIVIR